MSRSSRRQAIKRREDPQLILRKRLREEMEALRGLVRKAELLCGKRRAAPRCGKDDGRFLEAEGWSESPTEAEGTTCAKRRKTTPAEPRMSADEIADLVARVASLSENMPASILEFLEECTGHEDRNRGEIDIGSMRRSAMFELKKMLGKFAKEEKRRSPPDQQEDGEIVDICGDASPSAAQKVLRYRSPPRLLEDGEIEEEAEDMSVDVCGDASPVAEKFAGTVNSPGSTSSSCSDSSHCDSNGSGSEDESVASSPAPVVLASPMAVAHKVPCLLEDGEIEERGGASPVAAEKFTDTVMHSPRSSSSSAYKKINKKKIGNTNQSVMSESDRCPCCCGSPPRRVRSQSDQRGRLLSSARACQWNLLRAASYRDLVAKACRMQRRLHNPERLRAYEELEEMERNAKPISDWIHPMHLRQLGITPVEYAVTSERRVPGRGSPVRRLLGFFLKAE
uniref:NET domain-containing protein n=1 Tax=Setaria italica TaxID=4555 RepID=K3Y2G4_SETIT